MATKSPSQKHQRPPVQRTSHYPRGPGLNGEPATNLHGKRQETPTTSAVTQLEDAFHNLSTGVSTNIFSSHD